MNDCSTRSHCIFAVTLLCSSESRASDTKATLRLVDLAGSERFRYTHTNSSLFSESRSINLSLHYLEQVIVALNEKVRNQRTHIPYRNSVLTWILRDALGGNCRTAMIATISMDENFIHESLSTCRFAKRVSLIENTEVVNAVVHPLEIIARLERENKFLKDQISSLQGNVCLQPELTDSQIIDLKDRILHYLRGPSYAKFYLQDFQMVRKSPFVSFTTLLGTEILANFPRTI
jgi:kinesin family protein 6/9